MCKWCPPGGGRKRKCDKCRLWKEPAPPERLGSFVCADCDPTTVWNLVHYEALEAQKLAEIPPAKVLIISE